MDDTCWHQESCESCKSSPGRKTTEVPSLVVPVASLLPTLPSYPSLTQEVGGGGRWELKVVMVRGLVLGARGDTGTKSPSPSLLALLTLLEGVTQGERGEIHRARAEPFLHSITPLHHRDLTLHIHTLLLDRQPSACLQAHRESCLLAVEKHRVKEVPNFRDILSNLTLIGGTDVADKVKESIEKNTDALFNTWKEEIMKNLKKKGQTFNQVPRVPPLSSPCPPVPPALKSLEESGLAYRDRKRLTIQSQTSILLFDVCSVAVRC